MLKIAWRSGVRETVWHLWKYVCLLSCRELDDNIDKTLSVQYILMNCQKTVSLSYYASYVEIFHWSLWRCLWKCKSLSFCYSIGLHCQGSFRNLEVMFSVWFLGLFVCLSSGIRKTYWHYLHVTWWNGVAFARKEPITFLSRYTTGGIPTLCFTYNSSSIFKFLSVLQSKLIYKQPSTLFVFKTYYKRFLSYDRQKYIL